MLAAAEAALRPRLSADTTLSLVESTAENFSPPPGWRADLVTICRAFHWLDQSKILRRLDGQVNPGGAVAIFGDSSFWAIGSPWKDAVRAVIKDFLGEERRAGQGIFQHHDRPYNEFLEESAFNQVEEVSVPVHRKWTIESILGYLYSTSFASRGLFGERIEEFEATVKDVLADHGDGETFPEESEFLLRVGRRGKGGSLGKSLVR